LTYRGITSIISLSISFPPKVTRDSHLVLDFSFTKARGGLT
jgi:hypothetical protein